MTNEEHNALTQELLENHTDQAKVSTILATLTEDYVAEISAKTTAIEESKKLSEANEKLREANLSLFLKIGSTPEQGKPENKPENTTPKFDDLFDQNGNLK